MANQRLTFASSRISLEVPALHIQRPGRRPGATNAREIVTDFVGLTICERLPISGPSAWVPTTSSRRASCESTAPEQHGHPRAGDQKRRRGVRDGRMPRPRPCVRAHRRFDHYQRALHPRAAPTTVGRPGIQPARARHARPGSRPQSPSSIGTDRRRHPPHGARCPDCIPAVQERTVTTTALLSTSRTSRSCIAESRSPS